MLVPGGVVVLLLLRLTLFSGRPRRGEVTDELGKAIPTGEAPSDRGANTTTNPGAQK